MERWHAFERSQRGEIHLAQQLKLEHFVRPKWIGLGLGLQLFVALGSPVEAQESRAEILERQRSEKAEQVQPYQPTKMERMLLWAEERNPLTIISPHNGFFIEYGYSGKPVGSGIAFGGGWRHDILERTARVEFEVGQSFRNYNMVRGDFSLPRLAGDLFEIGVEGSWRRNPQEDFYGMGASTSADDRTSYKYEAPGAEARVVFKPADTLRAGTRFGYLGVDIGSGTDDRYPSTEQAFDEATAPGLSLQPSYLYTEFFANFDRRDSEGNPRAGELLAARWRRYDDRDLNRYSFDSLDLETQLFFPIFDKKRVFAVRGKLMTTTADIGHEVPFYFRPTLGGNDTLRSYSDFRFRDRNVFILNAEYRWEAFSGLDMAIFADAGQVAPTFRQLDVGDLKGAYGIGFRFNTAKAVFVRYDIAAGGSDGIHMIFKFSGNF